MRQRLLLLFFAPFLCVAPSASSGPVTYSVGVTINTSSVSSTAGSLDFNFSPGSLATQSASLQIVNFTSDGTLAGNCPCGTGDVSGQLPAALTFDNGTGFNDYFDDFTFGSTLSFQVSLYGPALSSPDGVSTSGSTFAFSMFFDPAGTFPVLTSDTADGFAFTMQGNLDGTVTILPTNPNAGGGVTISSINGTQLPPVVAPSQVATTASGLTYSRVSQTFNGTVILTNISGSAISGPLQILFFGTPANVTLVNATGNLSGTPYLTVPAVTSLAPGQSVTVSVQFKNPSNVTIDSTPVIYSGSIN